ncbi:putative inorganic phosphate cotransporter [Euwallacea similis]|uniref:putative inorganic phosphate cotransporter n=1 Tax=Euwallacea similis TaxID=1736056 RepID=UPI00345000D2
MNGSTATNGNHNYPNTQYSTVFETESLQKKKQPGWFGTRHFVTFMLALGMANAYIMRTNMSVAIVAMVNHTALAIDDDSPSDDVDVTECGVKFNTTAENSHEADGEFEWKTDVQAYVLTAFFYGYVITQIPAGILGKTYGNIYFLGVGMLINSVFGLLVPISAKLGLGWLLAVRFIQGLGEGPIVPCSHALLAKWIPPNERSRMGSFVYAGAQLGTVISLPLSGLLSISEWRWPGIFYVFGAVGTVWCIAFLIWVKEDPESNKGMDSTEREYIQTSLGTVVGNTKVPPIPWLDIAKSLPFWAILLAHMGYNYGYETLMTELPTYMKQVLHFSIKENGFLSALPYLAMWLFSILVSQVADWMLTRPYFTATSVRKILNSIGQFGPAVALFVAAFTGCDKWLTVSLLTIGVGLNGGTNSGFRVNHLDISPQFAGILMSFTNCMANVVGLLAPTYAGFMIKGTPSIAKWRIVFITASGVYAFCCTFYLFFASGNRQTWDKPAEKETEKEQKEPMVA